MQSMGSVLQLTSLTQTDLFSSPDGFEVRLQADHSEEDAEPESAELLAKQVQPSFQEPAVAGDEHDSQRHTHSAPRDTSKAKATLGSMSEVEPAPSHTGTSFDSETEEEKAAFGRPSTRTGDLKDKTTPETHNQDEQIVDHSDAHDVNSKSFTDPGSKEIESDGNKDSQPPKKMASKWFAPLPDLDWYLKDGLPAPGLYSYTTQKSKKEGDSGAPSHRVTTYIKREDTKPPQNKCPAQPNEKMTLSNYIVISSDEDEDDDDNQEQE